MAGDHGHYHLLAQWLNPCITSILENGYDSKAISNVIDSIVSIRISRRFPTANELTQVSRTIKSVH